MLNNNQKLNWENSLIIVIFTSQSASKNHFVSSSVHISHFRDDFLADSSNLILANWSHDCCIWFGFAKNEKIRWKTIVKNVYVSWHLMTFDEIWWLTELFKWWNSIDNIWTGIQWSWFNNSFALSSWFIIEIIILVILSGCIRYCNCICNDITVCSGDNSVPNYQITIILIVNCWFVTKLNTKWLIKKFLW